MTVLTLATLQENGAPRTLSEGTLVLVSGALPFRVRGGAVLALEALLQRMAAEGCSGLVVTIAARSGHQPYPQSLRDLADQIGVPLLTTAAPVEHWAGLHASIHQHRLATAEQRAAQLTSLVEQLPAQLADPRAMQRVADWLACALDAQVLVSEPDHVLAASPSTAAEHLAQAVIRQSVEGSTPDGSCGPHTQLISLASSCGAQTVLAVARRVRFDEPDLRLLQHAAKLLGLVDQACREYRVAADASQAARVAAVELLLAGEPGKARRVMASLTPGLLDADCGRVFVVQTDSVGRSGAVRRCETVTAGRALVVADPRDTGRILVIQPLRSGHSDETVAQDLAHLVGAQGPVTSLGGSGVYSLSLLGEALHEAVSAARFALHQPDSVALSAQHTDLVSLLPPQAAQHWARHLLRPLEADHSWPLFRDTLPAALAYPNTVAARRLDLHRNTVTRRVARAGGLLGLDLTQVHNRIIVGLALELVTHRALTESSAASHAGEPPALRDLLAKPHLHAWAEQLLCYAGADRRELLATAQAWLACAAHLEPTARMLGLSEGTVRSHLRALEGHMSRDLSSLAGMRDLMAALYLVTGRSGACLGSALCAAA
ncbi:helix-turn-helix domain-containing protein [Streptomyces sp. NPDC059037]|uniref:helix-turn-helix domain-containing protein n=1 Tax=Streptomyces sp. NPDC059037 TaxID=3346710 RepID=UPI0036A6B4BF